MQTIPPDTALRRLQKGNQRFVAGTSRCNLAPTAARRAKLLAGQQPFAIVLGCSDSRVPAELVFDQGLGDLFVIRVAGNVVAPSQVGSVEFAAAQFATSLVVVLGHTQCGAVAATVDCLLGPEPVPSENLRAIVGRVQPSVEPLLSTELRHHREALIAAAVRANVRASANHLRHGSAILEGLTRSGQLQVVGAEYSLETGRVHFFDGMLSPSGSTSPGRASRTGRVSPT